MYEFDFPDVGEGITEGKLIKWLVKAGDSVKADSAVAEVETDKAVVEIPSPVSGSVNKLLYNEGETVFVGKPLMLIDTGGSGEVIQEKKPEPKKEVAVQQSVVSSVDSSSVLALPSVRKYAIDKKVDLSKVKGTGNGGRITVEDVDNYLHKGGWPELAVDDKPKEHVEVHKQALASPSTRQLARDLNVDLDAVSGSGDNGTITKDDVKKASVPVHEEKKEIPVTGDREVSVPMSSVRKLIAKKMVESKHKAAHVTISDEADVTEIVKIRDKEKKNLEEMGIKLTYLAFFAKAVVNALMQHPYLNSTLDEVNEAIILKKYYNIGIATDTEKGLMVPVVKDAEAMSIESIARSIDELSTKAREGRITPAEMSGGTFTITSIGNLRGQAFTPIINYPEAAILGIGRITDKVVPVKFNLVKSTRIRKMMTLSLSFDHRIIDGAEAARFLTTLIKMLEDPELFFLELS